MKFVKVAYVVAFVMAALVVVGALTGPVVFLPVILIKSRAGIGILRRRVWSACGFALYEGA